MNWFLRLKKYRDSLMLDVNNDKSMLTIVDIGCRWGFAGRFIDPINTGKFRIYGFDPDEKECERLRLSYSHLPDGLVTCVPIALAKAPGVRNLFITKEPACSSLHAPVQYLVDHYPALDCISLEKIISINVDSLSNWAKNNSIESLDYIKIDTQGSELEILEGAGDLLSSTRCIDIEVEFNPIYQGQSTFSETDLFLRSKGFRLWRLSNLVYYSFGNNPISLEDKNYVCFDTQLRQETDAYGGQLFWADARYVNVDVFKPKQEQKIIFRDQSLFRVIGMPDVVDHLDKVASSQ